MTLKLGLTGSIGMGKSTTAQMFRDADVPVWDADATVHDLYAGGAAGAAAISEICPQAVSDRGVDRSILRQAILAEPALLKRIEAAIHPLVAQSRADFLDAHSDAQVVLFDIPLLYETGADTWLDKVIVVSAPQDVQKARVLARPGMTEDSFAAILARQTPDPEKRERADYVIDTSKGLGPARRAVADILQEVTE